MEIDAARLNGDLVRHLSRASKEAKLRWTDEHTGTYGVIDASDRDLARLYDAWVTLRDEPQAG